MNPFEYNYRAKHRFKLLTNPFEYNYRAKHRFKLLTNPFEYNYRAKHLFFVPLLYLICFCLIIVDLLFSTFVLECSVFYVVWLAIKKVVKVGGVPRPVGPGILGSRVLGSGFWVLGFWGSGFD